MIVIGNVAFTIVILAIVLGVLVFVHELGHYMAAKAFGVWVHRFAIGIGKPVPGLTFQRGETEWAIAWLPLGGYVKMASRELDGVPAVLEGAGSAVNVPPDRVFEAKPVWQRMIIILAGVTLNIVFALIIFIGLAWKNGRHYDPVTAIGRVAKAALPPEAAALGDVPRGTRITTVDGVAVKSWDDVTERIAEGSSNSILLTFDGYPDITIPLHRDALVQRATLAGAIEPALPPVVGAVGANTPAQRAGLAVGDSIVAINGAPIKWWADAVDRIEPAADSVLHVDVVRAGAPVALVMTPHTEHRDPTDSKSPMVGKIGAGYRTPYLVEPLSFFGAVKAGADASYSSAGTIFRTLRGLTNGRVATNQVGGPILIGQLAAQEAKAGIEPLLAFIALISINLAVVNLIPIPLMDGGAFLFLVVEAVIRRPLPNRVREAFSVLGLALIVVIMVVVFKNDILRLFAK
jgi:regulator of sigma E protease